MLRFELRLLSHIGHKHPMKDISIIRVINLGPRIGNKLIKTIINTKNTNIYNATFYLKYI